MKAKNSELAMNDNKILKPQFSKNQKAFFLKKNIFIDKFQKKKKKKKNRNRLKQKRKNKRYKYPPNRRIRRRG